MERALACSFKFLERNLRSQLQDTLVGASGARQEISRWRKDSRIGIERVLAAIEVGEIRTVGNVESFADQP